LGCLQAACSNRAASYDRILLPRFGDSALSGMRRESIETWYAERLGQVSATTANNELARLKHLLGRAETWGYLKSNPARSIRRSREAPGRTRYLSRLLNGHEATIMSSNGRTWAARREPNPALRLYVMAALQTGGRRGELVRLRWSDVDMRARTITFRHTKNGHARSVPMTYTMWSALATPPAPSHQRRRCYPHGIRRCSRGPSRAWSPTWGSRACGVMIFATMPAAC